jgi:6-phosphogluconolactonase (cycloisomerase 2 family)
MQINDGGKMRTLLKTLLIIFALNFAGCFDMYNEVVDDLDTKYNFYLIAANTNTDSYISTFSVGERGAINPINKTSGFGGTSGFYPAVHPNNKYLYVPNRTNGRLRIYNINSSGSLDYLSDIATEASPVSAIVHSSGKFVYVSNCSSSRSISMYQVNNDSLTGPVSVQTDSTNDIRPYKIAIHPSGNFLYTTIINNIGTLAAYVKIFTINNDTGSLTELGLLTITTTTTHNSLDIIIHPNGNYLYVSVSNGNIYKYNIKNDGTIDTSSSTYYAADPGTLGNYFSIHPSGKYLFTAGTNFVRAFIINQSDGTLTTNGAVISTSHHDITQHPNGKYLYVANSSDGERYNINDDGTITLVDSVDYSANGYLVSPWGLILLKKKSE